MNKFIRFGLAALGVLALTSCGSSEEIPSSTPKDSQTDASNTLVVYFSGTGNTKRVGEDIASIMSASTFEIVPQNPYSSDDLDYTNPESRVNKEHLDESLRNVPLETTEVPNWESFDNVFIGYPIWWGIAAWPVDTFVKANDFTGKVIYPFATSASSSIGSSVSFLERMANGGEWKEGHRFASSAFRSAVESWITSLGL